MLLHRGIVRSSISPPKLGFGLWALGFGLWALGGTYDTYTTRRAQAIITPSSSPTCDAALFAGQAEDRNPGRGKVRRSAIQCSADQGWDPSPLLFPRFSQMNPFLKKIPT